MVEFLVKDTGEGIAPAELPNIFEKFVQAGSSHSKNASGLGLGLAITRQLVSLQGGDISVESELGVGTVFKFSLPCWMENKDRNQE